jgi:hypothetical protein
MSGLDLVADPGLQISEVPVAYREGSKKPLVQRPAGEV